MLINFSGRNIEVTDALKQVAQEKLQRLEKRDNSISKLDVVFHVENLTHIAEGTAHLPGVEFHATAQADDMYSAIDLLVDKLSAQITKHKEKITSHR